jgi:hypothetical protein
VTMRPIVVCAALALTVCVACSRRPEPAERPTGPTASSPASGKAVATAGTSPLPAGELVNATVLEVRDASQYTYVRAKSPSGELWAAAPRFKVAPGDTVSISLDQPMTNFHSQALNRDFPVIYFVSRLDGARDASVPVPALAAAHGSGPRSSTATPQTADPPLNPTKDATSVENIWKRRDALNGKAVTVRGKVVKFNGGILGVNWLHLQDGTGSAAERTNDITVTTEDDATVGDVITVTGVVGLNKDLGSGYSYPVIIEHARIMPR